MSKTLNEQIADARKVVQEHAAKHPAIEAGCTPEQVHAFELMATGSWWWVHKEKARELVRLGLVIEHQQTIASSYEVPLKLVWQWHEWCHQEGRYIGL